MSDVLLSTWGLQPEAQERRTLRLLLGLAIAAMRADEGSLLLRDPVADDLVFAMTAGSTASEQALLGQRVPIGQGITGLAAQTHTVQIGHPTYTSVAQAQRPGSERSEQPQVVIAAPLLLGEDVLGVVTAVSFSPDARFGRQEEDILGHVATVAAQHLTLARQVRSALPALGGDSVLAAIGRDLNDILTRRPAALAQVQAVVAALRALA